MAEEETIQGVAGICYAQPRGMQFEACLERVQKTCQRFIFMLSLLELYWD
jgi:hypothetical protein